MARNEWYKNDTLKVISTSRTQIRNLEAQRTYMFVAYSTQELPRALPFKFVRFGKTLSISQSESDDLEKRGYDIV